MEIIIKILFTLLVVLLCRFFIGDSIKYFKQKKYWKVALGILLILYSIYLEFEMLVM